MTINSVILRHELYILLTENCIILLTENCIVLVTKKQRGRRMISVILDKSVTVKMVFSCILTNKIEIFQSRLSFAKFNSYLCTPYPS